MDASIRAKFPDDDHALGPFLGNLPPEILDAVVQKLGWFQTTFAMAGRTCREAVGRVPCTRAVLTEDNLDNHVLTPSELERLRSRGLHPLAIAVMEGDVEALEWLIQLVAAKGLSWGNDGLQLSYLAAARGKIESLTCLRANGCPWDSETCSSAAYGGHLEVLQWARRNWCPWDERTCEYAASGGHLEVLRWAHQNGCPWDQNSWYFAESNCRAYLREHGCPGAM